MNSLGQDIGTIGILLFCALSTLIRARYFCRFRKEGMLVCIFYILGTLPIRICSTHGVIDPVGARVVSGYFGIVCLCIQLSVMVSGEGMLREERNEHL